MDGRTLVRIFIDREGAVHADFRFEGLSYNEALRVNLRLDQLKARVLEGFNKEVEDLTPRDERDIDRLLDGRL